MVHRDERLLAELLPGVAALDEAELCYDGVSGGWQVTRVFPASTNFAGNAVRPARVQPQCWCVGREEFDDALDETEDPARWVDAGLWGLKQGRELLAHIGLRALRQSTIDFVDVRAPYDQTALRFPSVGERGATRVRVGHRTRTTRMKRQASLPWLT